MESGEGTMKRHGLSYRNTMISTGALGGHRLVRPVFFFNQPAKVGDKFVMTFFEPRYVIMVRRMLSSNKREDRTFIYLPNFTNNAARPGDLGLLILLLKAQEVEANLFKVAVQVVANVFTTCHWLEPETRGLWFCSCRIIPATREVMPSTKDPIQILQRCKKTELYNRAIMEQYGSVVTDHSDQQCTGCVEEQDVVIGFDAARRRFTKQEQDSFIDANNNADMDDADMADATQKHDLNELVDEIGSAFKVRLSLLRQSDNVASWHLYAMGSSSSLDRLEEVLALPATGGNKAMLIRDEAKIIPTVTLVDLIGAIFRFTMQCVARDWGCHGGLQMLRPHITQPEELGPPFHHHFKESEHSLRTLRRTFSDASSDAYSVTTLSDPLEWATRMTWLFLSKLKMLNVVALGNNSVGMSITDCYIVRESHKALLHHLLYDKNYPVEEGLKLVCSVTLVSRPSRVVTHPGMIHLQYGIASRIISEISLSLEWERVRLLKLGANCNESLFYGLPTTAVQQILSYLIYCAPKARSLQ